MHFKAVEAYMKQAGGLPLNMKFFIEGEEEVGSAHLDEFVHKNKQQLMADVVVISDTAMIGKGVPSICYGLRGLVYYQIDLAARKAICTPASSAAPSPTPRSCSARSWRR